MEISFSNLNFNRANLFEGIDKSNCISNSRETLFGNALSNNAYNDINFISATNDTSFFNSYTSLKFLNGDLNKINDMLIQKVYEITQRIGYSENLQKDFIERAIDETNEMYSRGQIQRNEMSRNLSERVINYNKVDNTIFQIQNQKAIEKYTNQIADIIDKSIVVGKSQTVEQNPMVEQTPSVEKTPVTEQDTGIEQPPIVNQTPAIEQVPIVEEPSVIEETPVVSNIQPVVEEKSKNNIDLDKINLCVNGGLGSYVGSTCITYNLSELEYIAKEYGFEEVYSIAYHYMDINAIVQEDDWECRFAELFNANGISTNGTIINSVFNAIKNAIEIADKTNTNKKYTSLICDYNIRQSDVGSYYKLLDGQSSRLCDFNGDGITDFNDLKELPEELDLDGDGVISYNEKQYLKELKIKAYETVNYGQMQAITGFYKNLYGYEVNLDAEKYLNNIEQIVAREEFRANNPEVVQMEETYIDLMLNPSHCTVWKSDKDVNLAHWDSVYKTMGRKYGISNDDVFINLMNRNTANWFWNRASYSTTESILDYHDTTKEYAKYMESASLSEEGYAHIINVINICSNSEIKYKLSEILKIAQEKINSD